MKTRLLILSALLLTACGKEEAVPDQATREEAAREAGRKELERRIGEEVRRASEALARADTEGAWAAWRAARDVAGETPDLARLAGDIRKVENEAKHAAAWKSLFRLLNADARTDAPEARLASLARAAVEARDFLAAHPESPHREEAEAGLSYAEQELRIHREFTEALTAARGHLAAGRHREAAAAAQRAGSILDRPEVAVVLSDALRALTPEGMIFVPGGPFLAGKNRERAFIGPFYIDRTEVTNARYAEFLKATGHPPPDRFLLGAPREGEEQVPVTWVTLPDAMAFAEWARKRLPTEREWERAARGTEGFAYPWGNDWDPAKGHFGTGGPLPVGSRPLDVSPEGVLDMAGNVAELTLSLFDREGKKDGPILKGGSWSDEIHPEYALAHERYQVAREHKDSGTGFRCVLTAPPP
ncbi:MAG: formylglycine-generating enzyme family protein [Planctomycetes bacterium]|jgi:formylglycine-generating enzyme required for sulfatase activity|nr:formylglycine-generating enzyme family protein [Planctomycetota bacterium]